MGTFKDYAKYYDVLYKDKDYEKEAKDVDALLSMYKSEKDLLVLGCGTGKHDRCLHRLGYGIHGIDMSIEMVREAKLAAPNLSYEVADIREYTPSRKYSTVISLFHVMSYQNTNEDVIRAFQCARRALELGGGFLFDCWYGPGVLTDPPECRIKEAVTESGENVIRIARPQMHSETNIVDVNYQFIINDTRGHYNTFYEDHHMRYFFIPEIQLLLQNAGFEFIECLDCKTLKKPNRNTWTVYIFAKAIESKNQCT